MPLYEYQCQKCNDRFELLRSFSEADKTALCPICQSSHTTRAISRVNAFISSGTERRSVSGGGGCGSCASTGSHACGSCHSH